jgi:hypothetical protein
MPDVNPNLLAGEELPRDHVGPGSRRLVVGPELALVRRSCQAILSRAWIAPLLLSTGLSVVLIERRSGLFHPHFLGTAILRWYHVPLFLVASAVVDLAVIYPLLVAWDAFRRLMRLGDRFFAVTGSGVALGAVVASNFVNYNVVGFLGDNLNIQAAIQVGNGVSGAMPYVLSILSGRVLIVGATCLGLLAACAAIYFMSGLAVTLSQPPLRRKAWTTVLILACAIGVEFIITRNPLNAVSVSVRKTSLQLIAGRAVAWATDFDGDGSGWIDSPPDFAPFDPQRHPFAVDIPGNGVDEDGIGGDLPEAAVAWEQPRAKRPAQAAVRPDILLIIPCSVRHDAVFGGVLGPSVTPFLLSLGKEGVVVDAAYSHTGFTGTSVPYAFNGHLAYQKESLIHDLKSFGYQVGVFSTQDEQFSSMYGICGYAAADFYCDAVTAMGKYGRKTVPSSTIVATKLLAEPFEQCLRDAEGETPLFVYVHLETAHFPYSHDSPLNIVPNSGMSGRRATASNRSELVEVYRNAVANLDVQISQFVSRFRALRHRPSPILIVFADHGESLFDDGMLGHGLALNEVQTRVPCIIVNGWGDIAVPFGHADLRPYLLGLLATPPPKDRTPRLIPALRPLFQCCGALEHPSQIAEVGRGGRVELDFRRNTYVDEEGVVLPLGIAPASSPRCLSLIHRWEALHYLRHVERQDGEKL